VDERMMHLFSLIADQVQKKQELFENEGKIMQSLLNSGCRIQEADAAITLMQTLVKQQSDEFFAGDSPLPESGMRAMNREERGRFSVEAFGFVAKLATLGIITDDQREDLLDRALTLYSDRIELTEVKSLVALALFLPVHEREGSEPTIRRIRKTAWN